MDNTVQAQTSLLGKLRQFWHLRCDQTIPDTCPVSLAPIANQINTNPLFATLDKELNVLGFENCCVLSNAHHLSEILLCLAENAGTHALSSIKITAHDCPEGIQIDVIDDGPGLHQEILESLGSPFLQPSHPKPSKNRGLGLGIYIAA